MTGYQEIATHYITTWNAADPEVRAALIADHWADEPSYIDPIMAAKDATELSAIIGGVHRQFPGFRFSLIGEANGYADHMRFAWGLGLEDSPSIVEGSDVVTLKDGRISEVIGFLDKVPA